MENDWNLKNEEFEGKQNYDLRIMAKFFKRTQKTKAKKTMNEMLYCENDLKKIKIWQEMLDFSNAPNK